MWVLLSVCVGACGHWFVRESICECEVVYVCGCVFVRVCEYLCVCLCALVSVLGCV